MQVDRRSGHEVRQILTALITDPVVLARIAGKWPPRGEGLFGSRWANLVAEWCVTHATRYDRPPGREILGAFEAWAARNKDATTIEAVERFLAGLSAEYEATEAARNSQYVIDLAEVHFNRVRMARLVSEMQLDLDVGDVKAAEAKLTAHTRVEIAATEGCDPFHEQAVVREALTESRQPVIEFAGDLGKFFRQELERDAFIVFMGPEKRGKSFWLLELAVRGLLARRRVAYFVCGDMSRNQVLRRLCTRIAGKPIRARTVHYPTGWDEEAEEATPILEKRKFTEPLSWQEAWRALQLMQRDQLRTKNSLLKIAAYPAGTLRIKTLDAQLQQWAREGWGAPDIIVLDFMDILDTSGTDDFRHRINQAWIETRGLAQKWHALILSATQASAGSYKKATMDMADFSEDKRKFGHVTGMIGLNQTKEEKDRGVMRLNWLVLREDEFSISRCIHVAGCPSLARPIVRSSF